MHPISHALSGKRCTDCFWKHQEIPEGISLQSNLKKIIGCPSKTEDADFFMGGEKQGLTPEFKFSELVMSSFASEWQFLPFSGPQLRMKTPDAGFEPATNGLTVRCSTAELIRNNDDV